MVCEAWMLRGVVIAVTVGLLMAAASANAATARTYVANCGSPSYLEFKPERWSSSCTGGGLNLRKARWRFYGQRSARASGPTALRYLCPETGCTTSTTYFTRAKLVLSRPRSCRDDRGRRLRYFARARFSARYRDGNPFGYAAGWRTQVENVKVFDDSCRLTPPTT